MDYESSSEFREALLSGVEQPTTNKRESSFPLRTVRKPKELS
jgi:hypothetical protein